MNYKKELDKVMSLTDFFAYRGCLIKPIIGGFVVMDKTVNKKEEIDAVIDAAMDKLSKSVTKQSETV